MLRTLPLLLFLLLLLSCVNSTTKKKPSNTSVPITTPNNQPKATDLQSIVDAAQVEGAILLYNPQKNAYHSNNFEWAAQGRLPASTFKIPNSMIALEEGIVADENTILKWNGVKRALPIWDQDMTFQQAFQLSCVPCYQVIARQLGVEKMQQYLRKLDYQEMRFDETTIDLFWLVGDSKITQFEQIEFLRRFYESRLAISPKTERILKKILLYKETDTYKLSAKTGWSVRENRNNGWFVGYLESQNKVYYFATNISPTKALDMKDFPKIRSEITIAALKKLQWLE